MKHFFTVLMIVLSTAAYSQAVMLAETFPGYRFNNNGLAGQSGSYNGSLPGWYFESSSQSIIEVDDAPKGSSSMALRFATGANESIDSSINTATSPNVEITSSVSRSVTSMNFQFEWYVAKGEHNDCAIRLQFSGDGGTTWNTVWSNDTLPDKKHWRTVVVPGGIPDSNSYWDGSDFRFRFTVAKNVGTSVTDVRIDNIQIVATSSGLSLPAIWSAPEWAIVKDLRAGTFSPGRNQYENHRAGYSLAETQRNHDWSLTRLSSSTILQQQNEKYDGSNSIPINNLGRLQAGINALQMVSGDETTNIN